MMVEGAKMTVTGVTPVTPINSRDRFSEELWRQTVVRHAFHILLYDSL